MAPDIDEKTQPVGYFFQNRLCDLTIESGPTVATQRDAGKEVERLTHRQRDDVSDPFPRDQNREALRLQPATSAGGTGLLDHELLELFAHGIRGRFAVALLDVIEDAFPTRLIRAMPALTVVLVRDGFARGAAQHDLLHGRREIPPRRVEIELVGARQRRQHHLP